MSTQSIEANPSKRLAQDLTCPAVRFLDESDSAQKRIIAMINPQINDSEIPQELSLQRPRNTRLSAV